MSDQSPIERVKELDKERAALFERAKEEALRRANQAVEDLNALGLNYRLVGKGEGNKTSGKKPKETTAAGADKKRVLRKINLRRLAHKGGGTVGFAGLSRVRGTRYFLRPSPCSRMRS
jgi:hypothetical protein